jgi:uncharacterized protein (DUF433 family)
MSTLPEGLDQKIDAALMRITRLEQARVEERNVAEWTYLVSRQHPWRRQLCVKGRNMTVGQLVAAMRANSLTPEQTADDYGLPIEAVREAIRYADEYHELIAIEAAEERRRLIEKGYCLEPQDLPR